jgi:hypothetical protein
MSLTFNEATHRYRLDRKAVPSVTGLLNRGLPNEALLRWAPRVVAEFVADFPDEVEALRALGREPMVQALKSMPDQKRNTAALRGTEVHAIAERVVHGEGVEVPPEHAAMVQGYVDFLDRFDVVPILTERSCANRSAWYAGRFDLIATVRGGDTWLLDAKTSKAVYGQVALQLAGYAECEFYVSDDDPDTEHPMPEIQRTGVLHITEWGTELVPMEWDAAVTSDWLKVLDVAKARKRIDAYAGEPITDPADL